MQINVTYDASTLAGAPAGFFSAVDYVVNLFDVTFTNNATINIEVGYGKFPLDGSTVSPLGESEQNHVIFGDYSRVQNILTTEGALGADTLPVTAPLTGQLVLGSAQQKALGLLGPSSALDGWVGIASNAALQAVGGSWSFNPTTTPGSGQFYLVGTLEHEFSEIMGRVSDIDVRGEYAIPDLYRYSASGARQTSPGDPAYFSLDNGKTNLNNWNDPVIGAGGDLGDWASNVGTTANFKFAGADAFLAFAPPGQINGLTSSDLKLMAALGWNSNPVAALSRFSFYAPGQLVEITTTPDGNNLPGPVSGKFNLELVTSPTGTAYPLPPGYQGVAILPGGTGTAIQLLSGDMTVVDNASGDAITLGSGSQVAVGAAGDTITGGTGAGVINALAGNILVAGGSGSMVAWAAAGDTIKGSAAGGSSTIVGANASTIVGGAGKDLVNALVGSEFVTGGAGVTTIWGGAGDTITGGGGTGLIDGTLGGELITGGSGRYTILGGAGDTITGGSGPTTIVGAAGLAITGGAGPVLINALAGSQKITGGSGDLTVWGGFGDTLIGGSGKNALDGQPGDTIIGGVGGGIIDGTLGNQLIQSGSGAGYTILGGAGDTIAGAMSDSIVGGSTGGDLINGLAGNMKITGGTGAATIWGGPGDSIIAGPGTALIAGQPGNTIAGGAATSLLINATLGKQSITGGSGVATVWGGGGDTIAGGSNKMSVVIDHIAVSGAVRVGDNGFKGSTTVTGFSQTAGDRIFFPGENSTSISSVVASATTSGGNTVITMPDGGTMTLVGVTKIDGTFFG